MFLKTVSLFLFRSNRSEVVCKKGVLGNCVKFTGKHPYQSLFSNTVADGGLQLYQKKRPWHTCFSWNFPKFLRTPPDDCFFLLPMYSFTKLQTQNLCFYQLVLVQFHISIPPENVRKPDDSLMFSWGRQKVHWVRMG